MPNQRAKNKIYLGGFVTKQFYSRLVAVARREGWSSNVFGFGMMVAKEAMDRRKKPEKTGKN